MKFEGNAPKIAFFATIIVQKRCKYQRFSICWLVAKEDAKVRICWYLHGFMQVIFQNTANTSVFEEGVKKHCKIQHFADVVL